MGSLYRRTDAYNIGVTRAESMLEECDDEAADYQAGVCLTLLPGGANIDECFLVCGGGRRIFGEFLSDWVCPSSRFRGRRMEPHIRCSVS